jgi:hypothetical protein
MIGNNGMHLLFDCKLSTCLFGVSHKVRKQDDSNIILIERRGRYV